MSYTGSDEDDHTILQHIAEDIAWMPDREAWAALYERLEAAGWPRFKRGAACEAAWDEYRRRIVMRRV